MASLAGWLRYLRFGAVWTALVGALWLRAAGARGQALPPRLFTKADGLPYDMCYSLTREPNGRLWVTGEGNAAYYEGQRFQPLHLPFSKNPSTLAGGPDGRLWMQFGNRHLGYLDDQRQPHPLRLGPTQEELVFCNFSVAPDNTSLFVPQYPGKLYRVAWPARTDRRADVGMTDAVMTLLDLAPERYGGLAFDSAGRVGVATRAGLTLFSTATGRRVARSAQLPAELRGAITAIASSRGWRTGPLAAAPGASRRGLWCATGGRLIRLATAGAAPPRVTHVLPLPPLVGGTLSDLLEDRTGQLWLHTDYALYVVQPATGAVRLVQRLADDAWLAQMLDDGESVWISTSAGLEQFPITPSLLSYSYTDGLPPLASWDIYPDPPRPGVGWLSTDSGATEIDLRDAAHPRLRWGKSNQKDGNYIAFGLDQRRDILYAGYADRVERSRPDDLRGELLARVGAQALAVDGAGRVWTFQPGHIVVIDPASGQQRELYGLPDAPRDRVFRPVAAPDGRLWLPTDAGDLVSAEWPADAPNPRFWVVPRTTPNTPLMNASLDSAGVLWLGTGDYGLFRFDTRDPRARLTRFRPAALRDVTKLRFSVPDNQGHLWLGDVEGVCRYTLATDQLERFDELQIAGNFSHNSGLMGAHGTFWFHNGERFICIDPAQARSMGRPPVVQITGTQVFLRDTVLKPWPGSDYPRLRHNQNYLSFQYIGISLTQPEKVRYRHRLVRGHEDDTTPWGAPVAATSATFTNLSPGTYRFEVKAASYNGVWSRQPATFTFGIEPPWWRSGPAYAIYALLTLALLQAGLRVMRRRERERVDRRAERARIVHLQQLDRAKSDFFTNISHELRTPLTLILGPAETLADAPDLAPDTRRQLGESVRRNARKLLALTNQLLDLSKLEAGALRLHLKPEADLAARVRQVVQQFASLADSQHQTLAFEGPLAPMPLVCDTGRVELVLTNLLANALKFTPAGGTVTVRVREVPAGADGTDQPAGAVVLTVQDTGRGIAARHHARLFDRFYQVTDEAAPEGRPGTGVGLALVRELMALHSGTVDVASAPGQGATFTVTLPRGLTSGGAAARTVGGGTQAAESAITEISGQIEAAPPLEADPERTIKAPNDAPNDAPDDPLTVLIVEDNAEVRAFIETTLAPVGYHLLTANDGQAGLETARAEVPDLIVSDVMMPRMDGYQLCHALKTDVATSHIPLVLLTAKASADDKIEGLETGADAFLAKPFAPRELLAQVRNLLTLRQQVRARFGAGGAAGFAAEPETGNQKPETLLDPLAAHVAAVAALPSLDQQFLRRVEAAVEARFDDHELSVEALAETVFLSRAQLHRKLKALTGLAPSDYVRHTRLLRAHALLAARVGTVAEIGYRVGFSSPSHFSAVFSRQFGYAPSEVPARAGDSAPSAL